MNKHHLTAAILSAALITTPFSAAFAAEQAAPATTAATTSTTTAATPTAAPAATIKTPIPFSGADKTNSLTLAGVRCAEATNTSVSIKFAGTGTKDVCIKVKDSAGTVEKKYFTVKVTSGALTNNSKISATSVTLGNSITLTGAASGGSGSYKYAAYYKSSSASTWNTKQEFNANNSISIKFTGKGTKDVCIKVKDSSGTVAKKYFTVTVK